MDLGKRLYELRRKENLTQDEVAEKLNVTRQTVSKWETNASTPDFDKIVPLCELYGISADELLKGEKQDEEKSQEDESEKFDLNEARKHLFTRGKDDDDDEDYENMTASQIKRKSAEVVSSSILIFFIAIAFAAIGTAVMEWNPVVVGCVFLVLIGLGVTRIVKHYMSIPNKEKTKEEEKEDKLVKTINDIIGAVGLVTYFVISFATMAWHITWVIFIICGILGEIVKLIFAIKGGDEDEK